MSYKIIGKYIKDLNLTFLIQKHFFFLSKNISKYKINIDINSNQINHKVIEILTSLSLTTIDTDIEKINTKIIFSTIVELDKKIRLKKKKWRKLYLLRFQLKFILS